MEKKIGKIDTKKLGMKVGLEFHQQVLATYPGAVAVDPRFDPHVHGSKLFCRCPAVMREEEPDLEFLRELRAVSGETGSVDVAARFEHAKRQFTVYKAHSNSTCLIEYDEEPIMPVNEQAMEVALIVARKLFKLCILDEIPVVRKIVVDGSNVSGFQRTMLVAVGSKESYIEVGDKKIGIDLLCLEEESAKNLGTRDDMRVFQLDRQGIPLIEVATAPDISSPEEATAVAGRIGALLRTTGRMKRGLGTIRQDLNISIREGTRVEIKGVQDLSMVADLVMSEATRQARMVELIQELKNRGLKSDDFQEEPVDVTECFEKTKAKFVKNAIKAKKLVLGLKLKQCKGLIGAELQPDYRFGTELSDRVKVVAHVGGILHSDEMPAYGISADEVETTVKSLDCSEEDAFVLVVDEAMKADKALHSINGFITSLLVVGLEGEVRQAKGSVSSYLRPLPGSSRMYPETDAVPFRVTDDVLARIDAIAVELPEEREKRYMDELKLSTNLAKGMALHPDSSLLEEIVVKTKVSPTTVATTILETVVALRRSDIPIENLRDSHFFDLFEALAAGLFDAKAIPDILTHIAESPEMTTKEVVDKLGLGSIDEDEVMQVVDEIVKQNISLIQAKGRAATGSVMGKVMKTLSGRASGKQVSALVAKRIAEITSEQGDSPKSKPGKKKKAKARKSKKA